MCRFACLLALLTGPVLAQNLLQNPGFELPAEGGVAHGWLNNTWGDCTTAFSLDPVNPHSGKTCQKIECVRRAGGASQFLQPLKIQAGKLYRVRLWVRAAGNVPYVGAALRQSPAPYKHHVTATFEPGPDWELFEFQGVTLESEEQAGLYIWFEADGTGTVWVDDASVEVSDTTVLRGPTPPGNVIPNGSFEVDPTRTWDATGGQIDWPCGDFAAHGSRSLHVKLDGTRQFELRTPCFEFSGNDEPFTLACSVRAAGIVPLTLHLQSAMRVNQAPDLLNLAVNPTEKLQRYEVRGPVANSLNGAYFVSLVACPTGPAELWLDAVSLSRKGAAFEPAAPIEAALSTGAFAGIFAPDEPVRVKLELSNAGQGLRTTATVCVRDWAERVVCQVPVPVEAASGSVFGRELVLPVKRLGAFRADVSLDPAQPPLASMVFSVIPRPSPVPPERSLIGGHFSTASDWQMQIARRLGYKWTRIHDCSEITHWRSSEPEKGQWRFYDDQVQRVRGAGLAILGEFLRVPEWATTAAKGSDAYSWGIGPFRDMGEFENYVRTVVGHYRGEIHHWEIWNEPYGEGFWGGTPDQYAALAQTAARAAKTADATCKLLAPCTTPFAPEWTSKALAAGALRGADLFSYHGYGCLSKAQYDRVNEWATRDGKLLTRWNTETGVTARTFYRRTVDKLDDSYSRWIGAIPMEEAVQQSLELFVLAIASGAERYFYYWTNVEPGMCPRLSSMSIYEYDHTIRPHGVVYALAASMLDPCTGAGVRDLPGGITCCLLQRQGETVAVVWTKSRLAARQVALRGLPGGSRILDAMGNPVARGAALRLSLSKTPLYVIAPGIDAPALGELLQKAVTP